MEEKALKTSFIKISFPLPVLLGYFGLPQDSYYLISDLCLKSLHL